MGRAVAETHRNTALSIQIDNRYPTNVIQLHMTPKAPDRQTDSHVVTPSISGTASSHFPPLTPCLQTIYPSTPTVLPIPNPPTRILQLQPDLLPSTPTPTPPSATPTAPHPSTSTCPLFSNNLHARSFHSISPLPHIRPGTIAAPIARPHTAPVPVERRSRCSRGGRGRVRAIEAGDGGAGDDGDDDDDDGTALREKTRGRA